MTQVHQDTITAIATAPGRGGVGIIRVSGEKARYVASAILGYEPKPRYAHYGPFKAADGTVLDEGIALFFPNPNSFTGEDVLELQGHGGPVVLDLLLKEAENSQRWANQLLEIILDVASRRYAPRLASQGNTDFQLSRGLLGVSL